VLRITSNGSDDRPRLKVEGRVADQWADELDRVVSLALSTGPVVMDLSEVTFVDQHGAGILRRLRGRGVRLAFCSAFVTTLLAGEDA
jgi:anti-anti-sigma regulatory factor